MLEGDIKELVDKTNALLKRASVCKCISEAAGMPVEHQTGSFGNIMPKKKKGLKLVPKDIADEKRGLNKTCRMFLAIQKLDSQGEEGINAGFGREEKSDDEVSDKDESIYVPEDIKNEKGLVYKASYEHVTEGVTSTDETSPADDSFYLPSKIRSENGDTDKEAKKKDKQTKDAQSQYFGKVPDNPNDQGRARVKQNYNVGTIENAQIGNQGGMGGIGKSKEKSK